MSHASTSTCMCIFHSTCLNWLHCQTDCGRSQKARSHPPTHPSITNWWLFTRLSTPNYDSLIYSQNQTQTTPGCNCQKTPFHFAKVFGCFHIVIFRTKIWPHERFLLFQWKGIAKKKKSFSMFHCNFALTQVSFPRFISGLPQWLSSSLTATSPHTKFTGDTLEAVPKNNCRGWICKHCSQPYTRNILDISASTAMYWDLRYTNNSTLRVQYRKCPCEMIGISCRLHNTS